MKAQAESMERSREVVNVSNPPSKDQAIVEKQEITAFRNFLWKDTTIRSIRELLPNEKKKDVERILRIAFLEYINTPTLHVCSIGSVGRALMNACRLGLEVGSLTGHAYLIPYKDHNTRTTYCNLQVGYKGLVEIAYKMGNIRSITATTVYSNEKIKITGGTNAGIEHEMLLSGKGDVIGYYVVVDVQDARPVFLYMSVEEIAAHRAKFSRGGGRFWTDFPEQMAYKTIFIKLFKWLPKNPMLQVVEEIERGEYVGDSEIEETPRQTKASQVALEIEDDEEDQIQIQSPQNIQESPQLISQTHPQTPYEENEEYYR